MLQRSRESNNVHQGHMSKITDAPPWNSCDVTQFSHYLQRIKIKLTSAKTVWIMQMTWYAAYIVCNCDIDAINNAIWSLILIKTQVFHLFPFSDTEDEWSHSDNTNTKKHVVFSHCHKLLSVKTGSQMTV